MKIRNIYTLFIILSLILVTGIVSVRNYNDKKSLYIATTTSVDNTGLLDLLIDTFSEDTGIEVYVIAVGSGAAIDFGRKGEVDALIVHAPELEQGLINEGIGVNHTTLWYNYFIIAGPKNDPANISGATSAQDAFDRIYNTKSKFYSRGDNSGTHVKELSIWTTVPSAEKDDWYVETGSGMSSTLTTANENDGYVLTDLGTYTQLHATNGLPNLEKLFTEDSGLFNPYSFMLISPDAYKDLHTDNALQFLEFLLSDKANNIVRNLIFDGVQLFTPIGE